MPPMKIDQAEIRRRLGALKGPEYWRGLEELADTPEFKEYLKAEFPSGTLFETPISRRRFLQIMGAGLALAATTACKRPIEAIIPYNEQPEGVTPGIPLYFATGFPMGGSVQGILVESHTGRPTKVEGNPLHPESLGATDVFAQGSLLTLYDPDRAQVFKRQGAVSAWGAYLSELYLRLLSLRKTGGEGLRILTDTVTSPTLARQLSLLRKQFPAARWHSYEPLGDDNRRKGLSLILKQPSDFHFKIDQADVLVSLGSDFLSQGPGHLRYARDFASRRKVAPGRPSMNRLYVAETTPSITGSMADHRLALRPRDIEWFARVLAEKLNIPSGLSGARAPSPLVSRWAEVVSRDLVRHRGKSLLIIGPSLSPEIHALGHAANHALQNQDQTLIYTDPVTAGPSDQVGSLGELARDMEKGKVGTLLILGGNPVYDAPGDFRFGENLSKVDFSAHLGHYEDETSEHCLWHIPEAHPLESWSDGRAFDGTSTIIQPLIEPLYGGKTAHEILAPLLGPPSSSHTIVRDYWTSQRGGVGFDRFWKSALHDGVIPGTALSPKQVFLKSDISLSKFEPERGELDLLFQPDPHIWDGRFANNGWLQELPKPITTLTWDNAAFVSPALAQRLNLSSEEVVELDFHGHKIEVPIWILPGQADRTVTVSLGYGRTRSGHVGTGLGVNAYPLRSSDALWSGGDLKIRRVGKSSKLAAFQHHHAMEGRDQVRMGTLDEYRRNPAFAGRPGKVPAPSESLFPPQKIAVDYAWAMTIDLNTCIGCNACTIACQAENNIPVVGKDQVARGREMHWIRVDRYFKGSLDDPEFVHQPVPCMHCEDAPCELVCPVGATVHSREGLNEMIYNRCIGTRYCSNNCPYKVRRFNFYLYSRYGVPTLKLMRNPDVTVRARGVMEKCSYCVQRITRGRITAEKENRKIRDGEVVTACQAACPTQAIVFGSQIDPEARVAREKADPRNYQLLSELGTRPRTSYLARITNPNPELEGLA